MTTFVASSGGVTRRRACSRCHSRKVRCQFSSSDAPCINCIASGDRCEKQARKRRTMNKQSRKDQSAPARLCVSPNLRSARDSEHRPVPDQESALSDEAELQFDEMWEPTTLNLSDAPHAEAQGFTETIPSVQPRATSFVNRGAILPDTVPGLDNAEEQQMPDCDEVDMKVLELYHTFDLPPRAIRQSLVDAFFEHCWVWMPVVDPDSAISESRSYLLLQALFVAGSQMRINSSKHASPEEYLRRVKALLDASYEKDPLTILAALCMVQWWNHSPPHVVSTTTSKFWVTYGVNIAQQIGLHRKAPVSTPQAGLRKRIWWSLFARDCLVSSAHGRPRSINPADCTLEQPRPEDFPDPTDPRAKVFCAYVSICSTLADLCEALNRSSSLPSALKTRIGESLLSWIRSLPQELKLFKEDGSPRPYNFQACRLHIVLFTAIMILHRPISIFKFHPSCAAAVIASRLASQLFEIFLLRDQVHFLNGAYAWQLLVTAIPQLPCTTILSLKGEAEAKLDGLEDVLQDLARKLPSAANNLKNVKRLRDTVRKACSVQPWTMHVTDRIDDGGFDPTLLFSELGSEVCEDYDRLLNSISDWQHYDETAMGAAVQEQPQQLDTLQNNCTSTDANFDEFVPSDLVGSFSGSDWILDLMNGISSWR